jgi:hypothetical protein
MFRWVALALLVLALCAGPVAAAKHDRYTIVAEQAVIQLGQGSVRLAGCGYAPARYIWVRSLYPSGMEAWNLVTPGADGCFSTWGAAVTLGEWTYTANHFKSGTVLASTTATVVP